MDALLSALLVAGLGEFGDRTQLLAVVLAARFARPAQVLVGIALAATCGMALAGVAGAAIHAQIDPRAAGLCTGVALLLAAAGAVPRPRAAPPGEGWRLGALLSSFGAFLILELGDKTQFVTAAIAAQTGWPVLAAAGAALGVTLASVPAVLLGPALARTVPLRAIHLGAAALFALAGAVVAIRALDLV